MKITIQLECEIDVDKGATKAQACETVQHNIDYIRKLYEINDSFRHSLRIRDENVR